MIGPLFTHLCGDARARLRLVISSSPSCAAHKQAPLLLSGVFHARRERAVKDASPPTRNEPADARLKHVPMHFLPFDASRKPSEQKHWYDPCRLTHWPSQPPLSTAHSSMSAIHRKKSPSLSLRSFVARVTTARLRSRKKTIVSRGRISYERIRAGVIVFCLSRARRLIMQSG